MKDSLLIIKLALRQGYILYILIISPPPLYEIHFSPPTNKFAAAGGGGGAEDPPAKIFECIALKDAF